jgi:hypothetical protein
MPSNKSLTETILSINPEAEGLEDMSNAQLCNYLRELRAPAVEVVVPVTVRTAPTYRIAEGKAITSRKGFLTGGMVVTEACFAGGLEALLHHVKKGTIIES